MSLNQNHNDKFARSLNESFENWDGGSPSETLWNKLDGSLDNNSKSFEASFNQWDSAAPSDSVWSKLNASLDAEVKTNRSPGDEAQSLSVAFNDWIPDVSNDIWSKLDEELSTSKVWDNLSASLDNEANSAVDEKFRSRYQEWSTGTNHDGWNKLEEALSRERVWNRLAVSLTQPVGLPSMWWKYAVSFLAFMFMSLFMNDQLTTNTFQLSQIDAPAAPNTSIQNKNENFDDNSDRVLNDESTKLIANNQLNNGNKNEFVNDTAISSNGIENNTVPNSTNTASNDLVTVDNSEYLANLESKGFNETDNCSNVKRIKNYIPERSHLSLTFALGSQLSQSNSSVGSNLRTSAPRPGFAADVSINRHFGRWGIFQDFGYVSFTQANGDFVKGRYQNSIQKLNTIQSTSGVFYSFNRFDVNAGVVFTRMLNGLEQENDKIINVYNTNSVQTGINAGFTYNFSPKRDVVRYGLGVQYQWIPSVSAGTTQFRDIQGLKIQAKISF